MKKISTIPALFLFVYSSVYGQGTTQGNGTAALKPAQVKWTTNPFNEQVFIKNNGQFDGKGNTGDKILYGAHLGKVNIYFTEHGIIYRYDKITFKKDNRTHSDPDDPKNLVRHTYFLTASWQNASHSVSVWPDQKLSNYYTYPNGTDKTITATLYKKIEYRNIYPNIDVLYEFPQGKQGIEYTIILHPGANLSDIKIDYSGEGSITKNSNGDLLIKSGLDILTEHALSQTGNNQNATLTTVISGNSETFSGQYDKSQTLVIDPWITDPLLTPTDAAYDLDWDYKGNVYAYGGDPASDLELVKMNSAGVIQWTYNAAGISGQAYGDFATDKITGTSYIGQGFSGGQVLKVNSGGALKATFPGQANLDEIWRVEYDACTGNIVIAGGGTNGPYQAGVLDTSMITLTPVNIMGVGVAFHDNALETIDPDGKTCYMASARSYVMDPLNANNVIMRLPLPTLSPTQFEVQDKCDFVEVNSVNYAGFNEANGMNGAAASPDWLYLYDDDTVGRYNKLTGAYISGYIPRPGHYTSLINYGGLAVDDLNNLYIGVRDSLYIVDSTYAMKSKIKLPDSVYDVQHGQGNALYACGLGYVTQIVDPVYKSLIQTVSGSQSSCSKCDGTANLTVLGGITPYKFRWSNGDTNQNDTGLCEGIYTVYVTDASCPPKKDSAVVTVSSKNGYLISVTDTNPSCGKLGNITAHPTGGSAPYSFQWSNGETNQEDTGLIAGTYSCTVTDDSGCKFPLQVTLINPAAPSISISPVLDSACRGVAVQLIATGGKIYKWQPGNLTGDTVSVTPPNTTTYTITGTDSNGCSATATATVKVLSTPSPGITGSDSICFGAANGTLTASNGFSSYSWAPGGQNTQTITGLSAGSYTVTVSNGGCNGDTVYTIHNKPNPIPAITASPDSICAGDSSLLTAGGGGTYAWSNPPGGTSPTVKVAAGTYTLAVTKNGCTHDTTITVVPLSNIIPTIGLTANNLCPNDSTTLKATGGTSYKWLPGGISSANITVDPGTTSTYTCAITTPCRVIDTTITVTYKHWPAIGIGGDTSICLGNSGVITATGGGTYNWNNGQTSGSIIIAPAKDSVFSVQVTLNGCSKDTSINVNVHTVPHVTVTPPNKICIGNPFTLTASGACNYLWSNGATTSSITVSPASTTTYTVKAWCYNDTVGCDTTLGSQIIVDVAQLHACCDTTIVSGDTASLSGNGSSNYVWTPNFGLSCDNCPNPVATPSVTTTYTVSSIDTSNGCTRDTAITVVVNRPCNNIYAPNVFTPNNDGINDDFVISVDTLTPSGERSSWSNFTFYSIAIFDRWGKEVFSSTDPAQPWNGRVLNSQDLVPDGVYYYVIKTTCGSSNGEKKGFVEVLGEK